MAEVVIARRAAADLQRLRTWLAEKDPDAAERAAEAIDARIMRLRSFPRLGPLRVAPDTRELRVRFGRYGYIVRYVLRDEIVVVTRISTGAKIVESAYPSDWSVNAHAAPSRPGWS